LLGAIAQAGQGGIKAALGHTGMPTELLALGSAAAQSWGLLA